MRLWSLWMWPTPLSVGRFLLSLGSPFWTTLCLKRCSRCSGPGLVSTGFWAWVPKIAGCKNPVSLDFLQVLLHFCSPADTVPLKGRTAWLDCGSCLFQSVTLSSWVWTSREGVALPQCGDYFWTRTQSFPFLPTLCNLAPTGGSITACGAFVTRFTELKWPTQETSFTYFIYVYIWHALGFSPFLCGNLVTIWAFATQKSTFKFKVTLLFPATIGVGFKPTWPVTHTEFFWPVTEFTQWLSFTWLWTLSRHLGECWGFNEAVMYQMNASPHFCRFPLQPWW